VADLVEKIGRSFKSGFDEIFPPVDAPVQYEERRKKMMQQP
jgi:hypothetical protein